MARSTAPPGAGGLQRELTSFVGRRRELREIKEALSSTSLLTLIGPAGVGKTRLALRTASDLRRALPDGVWVVELAGLRDPALVSETVAHALELQDVSSRWLVSTLVDYLASRRLLLILDNCEHLLHSCAVLVDALLRACPDLKVLTTSREPLGISGEAVLQVEPLTLPPVVHIPPRDALLQYEGVRLFVDRSQAASSGFDVTPENGEAVARLCLRLDGLPLAIELAAVRTRAFTVEQILSQMDDRFRLLTTGSRAASPRQKTLRAAIEWSFGLLSEEERILWRRLSVFAGGFEVKAAQQVCSGNGVPREEVLDLVASLVEKSLLIRLPRGATARYRMLETIRDFGREQLGESGEEPAVQRRHRDWYVAFANEVREQSWGPLQKVWWDQTLVELPNLREVLHFCLTTPGEVQPGLSIASDLCYCWHIGYVREGRRWLDGLLELDPTPSPERARALASSAWMAFVQMDIPPGVANAEAARGLATELGDDWVLGFTLEILGLGALFQQQLEEASNLLEEALRLWQRLGDSRHLAMTLSELAAVWTFRGDAARSIDLYRQSALISRELGDQYFQSWALFGEGLLRWQLGELELATALMAESIRLKRAIGERLGVAMPLEAMAWIAMSSNQVARAVRLLGGAQKLLEETGAVVYPPYDQHHDACVREAHARLPDREFDRLFQAGRGMSAEETIALALQEEAEPVQRRGGRRGLMELTSRERQIAGLVAQGLSNRDIASRLVISQRTAETHVEHILTKLGFTSRAQIAAWVVEQDASTASSAPTHHE